MKKFKEFVENKKANKLSLKNFEDNLRYFLEKNLYQPIEQGEINKDEAILILRTIVSESANKYGLVPPSSPMIKTNSELSSPPLQPQAE